MTTPTADEITQHMVACGHAVLQIDGIKAGTDPFVLHSLPPRRNKTNHTWYAPETRPTGVTQTEINEVVQRSVDHLKIQKTKQWYIDDRVTRSGNETKAKHTTAIKTGEDYIAANS